MGRLAEYQLERADAAWPYRDYGYTFNQMFGVQSGIPAFLINQHKVTSLSDAEAYISRLNGVPDYLGQNVANAKAAAAKGIQPPSFVYDYVLSDSKGVITGYPFSGTGDGSDDSPLMADFREKVAALASGSMITEEQAGDLLARAAQALKVSVGPAYEAAITELVQEQLNATADDGVWKLPDGEAYYNMRLAQVTTTELTADEIHQIPLHPQPPLHHRL